MVPKTCFRGPCYERANDDSRPATEPGDAAEFTASDQMEFDPEESMNGLESPLIRYSR